ncbi:hypothetical protein ONZ45_g16856 [Pleurotus djamor]|nr:hypothetical protein ONZ45_g16856 [Pleurotus djamor]
MKGLSVLVSRLFLAVSPYLTFPFALFLRVNSPTHLRQHQHQHQRCQSSSSVATSSLPVLVPLHALIAPPGGVTTTSAPPANTSTAASPVEAAQPTVTTATPTRARSTAGPSTPLGQCSIIIIKKMFKAKVKVDVTLVPDRLANTTESAPTAAPPPQAGQSQDSSEPPRFTDHGDWIELHHVTRNTNTV